MKENHGEVDFTSRTVVIDPAGDNINRWQTYWHETGHILLWDGGVHQQLTNKQREAVCDAIGTYLCAMQQAGYLKVTIPPRPSTT